MRLVVRCGLVCLVVLPPVAGVAAPCATAVALAGDDEAVAALGQRLASRGVPASPGGCGALRAIIVARPSGMEIAIVDGDGRAATRQVGSVDTAAALVESWSRSELDQPALAPTLDAAAVAPAPASPRRAIGLRLTGDGALGGDGSRWAGATGGICIRLGPVCTGVAMRYERDVGGGPFGAAMDRDAAAALVTASAPITLGPVALVPSLAAGGARLWHGWRRDGRDEGGRSVPDASDGRWTGEPREGTRPPSDGRAPSSGDGSRPRRWTRDAVRVEARLSLIVPLAAGIAAEAGIGGEAAPWPRGDDRGPYGSEPGTLLRAGVGVAYFLP